MRESSFQKALSIRAISPDVPITYPGPFTPLKKLPRWPVSTTTSTATSSSGKRYASNISCWFWSMGVNPEDEPDHAERAGSRPGHALQKSAPVNPVVVVQELISYLASHRFSFASRYTKLLYYLPSPLPSMSLGRAARVRESREPAPHMGRVSSVQTAPYPRLFPVFFAHLPLS
jgi:hypothetical protein